MIAGGWVRNGGDDEGHFGVKLDLARQVFAVASTPKASPKPAGNAVGRLWHAGLIGKLVVLTLGCFGCFFVAAVISGLDKDTQKSVSTTNAQPAALVASDAKMQVTLRVTLVATAPPATAVASPTQPPIETPVPPSATAEPTSTPISPEPTAAPEIVVPTDAPTAVAVVAIEEPTAVPPTEVPVVVPTAAAPVAQTLPPKPNYAWNWGSGTTQGAACGCGGPDLNCADFASWDQAQACFMTCGGTSNDVFKLDGNNNGVVCEKAKK